jgi:phage-related protein
VGPKNCKAKAKGGQLKPLQTTVNKHLVHNEHSYIDIMYTNADQLKNKLTELKLCTSNGELSPKIIAITEVKPKNNRYAIQPSEFTLNNYTLYPACTINILQLMLDEVY